MLEITGAEIKDLPEILNLQYTAYQSEAELVKNWDIPPLKQTLKELEQEFSAGTVLIAAQNGCIVGSVRAYVTEGTLFIGKLMVHPKYRGNGIGTKLLLAIEHCCPHRRCELFTSSKSVSNLRLYQRLGYEIFDSREVSEELIFVYLEKPCAARQ